MVLEYHAVQFTNLPCGLLHHMREGLYGYLPIHASARHGDAVIFQMLIDKGADIHAKDRINQGVIHYAATGGSIDILKKLLALTGHAALEVCT